MEFPCRAFLCACGGRYAPPPHAWGIQRAAHAAGRLRRFIPTCVGNTGRRTCKNQCRAVHPHMRGEYEKNAAHFQWHYGSSPHAWGIRKGSGKTGLSITVHPHMRGEYSSVVSSAVSLGGSSPHAWGIPLPSSRYNSWARFIPTCVGNTFWGASRVPNWSVHPHVRGEYLSVPA